MRKVASEREKEKERNRDRTDGRTVKYVNYAANGPVYIDREIYMRVYRRTRIRRERERGYSSGLAVFAVHRVRVNFLSDRSRAE